MPICVERRSPPAYVNAIDDAEESEIEPWYASILKYKETREYAPDLDTRGKRALRMLAAQFIRTYDGKLYKRTAQDVLLRCINKPTAEKVMEEVHYGECWTHMNAHMLVWKIMRLGYYWTTMETDCRKYVRYYHNCHIFANVQHVPHSMLYTMTSPWAVYIIAKVNPSGTEGHYFILVAIDYFTEWVEAMYYKVLNAKQTNGAVEAVNKTVATILRKMSANYKEWSEKIPFALWGYMTSIRTATGATPYYLVYGRDAVQPVALEILSLRILLESQVTEAEWVQVRYDSLVILDERWLNALYHVQLNQKRIERAFNKKVKPREINEGDLVLMSVRALLPIDPRDKFKPKWASPYLVKKILSGGDVWLTYLDRNDFMNPRNLDQLKKYYP
ncbi:uncharacterized protein LOC141628787 [Silene latifolia]|uniref:uncharacterized protein LOC141628787 n=1 Tax=Silene latifolia TaxID=37657 RepID=UPI003D7858CC